MELGLEFRALDWKSRHSATGAIPPVIIALVIWRWVFINYLPKWALTSVLWISGFQNARTTDMMHPMQAERKYFQNHVVDKGLFSEYIENY
jgi:hypothetical protein